jgi:prepilin-type N-terminal cleavage/methylation domain-containing protein
MRGERGFTLPELLIVMMILGLLLAIAIPSFLRSRNRGDDTQAHAALRAGLAAERTRYVDYQTYTEDGNLLRAVESNVVWDTTNSRVSGVMAKIGGVPSGSAVVLASWSNSTYTFCIMNIAVDQAVAVNGQTQAGTYYAKSSTTATSAPTAITTSQCGTTGYTRDSAAGWAN